MLGVLFLALSWAGYLRLDGVRVVRLPKKEKKVRFRSTKDIVDFVDEHIVSFNELSETEQAVCTLTANLLSGILFTAISLGHL